LSTGRGQVKARIARATAVAAVALIVTAIPGSAGAQNILDRLTGGMFNVASRAWQGSWGIDGRTPVITVAGVNVSYRGTNRQQFAVSNVNISDAQITFRAGRAEIALTRRSDTSADFVSTIGEHSSAPILLCRSDAARCP
jgi:hypothetical protein